MTNEEIKQATPKEKFNDFHKQVAYEFGFEQGVQWAGLLLYLKTLRDIIVEVSC